MPHEMVSGPKSADGEVEEILASALAGQELSVRDGIRLWEARDQALPLILKAADILRHRQKGSVVTYVKNRNINFTNICTGGCKFCAFSRSPGEEGGYVLSEREIKRKVREAILAGATEVCVQGGLHPDFGLSDYERILLVIRGVAPFIHVHAFSPAEIDHICRQEGVPAEEALLRLKGCGLDSMPGTAAEVLSDRVRNLILSLIHI